MAEIFTTKEVEEFMRSEVNAAGGARKWLRKNGVTGLEHVMHMVADGRAATLDRVLLVLGFRRVALFESTRPGPDNGPDNPRKTPSQNANSVT